MKWIIVGGCGFIGINLVKYLLEDPKNKVCVVDNLEVGKLKDLKQVCKVVFSKNNEDKNYGNDWVEFLFHDISKNVYYTTNLKHIFNGADVVVHLAAMSGVRESVEFSKKWFDSNVQGTFNVLEAAKEAKVKKVIFASSGATIGNCDPPINENLICNPISPYGASKLCGEAYMSAYYHSYGIETTSLRFSNVYGPYSTNKTSLVAKFIKHIINDEVIEIYGDGEQTRDFIYINDLIKAIYKCAITKGIGGQVFQLSTAIEISINYITDRIIYYANLMRLNKGNIKVNFIDPKVGDIKTNWADNSKIKEMLNWEPKVNLEYGIVETMNWFRETMGDGDDIS